MLQLTCGGDHAAHGGDALLRGEEHVLSAAQADALQRAGRRMEHRGSGQRGAQGEHVMALVPIALCPSVPVTLQV